MEDDTLKDKEQEELKALLDNPDEGAFSDEDNQDSGDNQDKDKTSTEAEGENSEDANSENDENSSEDDSNSNNNKDDTESETASANKDNEDQDKETKDRWHGKSREEVIKAYESLEARVAALENKADSENKTDQDNNPPDEKAKSEESEDNNNDENNQLGIPSADELQKMTPTDFAKWVLGRIDEGVKRTIETQEKIRDAVHQEISEAKKEHPLQDPDYRKMVLAIIDAASAKGTTIPLKEACNQVDAFLGKHKGQSEDLSNEEKSRLKKAKAQVESGAGAPTQPDGSDAETKRIQKALAGSGSKSPLGGLGI